MHRVDPSEEIAQLRHMNCLVTGGLGYIGAAVVSALVQDGHRVVIVDRDKPDAAERLARIEEVAGKPVALHLGELLGGAVSEPLLKENAIDVVFHLAARRSVRGSRKYPRSYYENNVGGLLKVLSAMDSAGVRKIVFASTAAVYGVVSGKAVPETHPLKPLNPYARSKVHGEEIVLDIARANPEWSALIFRLFNPSGPDRTGRLCERRLPEKSSLMSIAMEVLEGNREMLRIFGGNLRTPDGTPVRDYVDLDDVVRAHVMAIPWLKENRGCQILNIGSGQAVSVLDLVHTLEEVSGRKINCRIEDASPGEIPELVADIHAAEKILGWAPALSWLETCSRSWKTRNPS